MASTSRIRNGTYTEADIQAIFIKHRENGIGPFTREVGDFIAHAKRDRGATLEATAFIIAQFAFFQTYQSTIKRPLNPKGSCGWWLRHYLLTKARRAAPHELRKAAGLSRIQAERTIKSWFPGNESYPTQISCDEPLVLLQLANHFGKLLEVEAVFEIDQVKKELVKLFDAEKIDKSELDRFIVGTATLLNGKSVEIVPGFIASLHLGISNARHEPVGLHDGVQYVKLLPDGNLEISVRPINNTGDGIMPVGFSFLETAIDSEAYVSRSLVAYDEWKIARLRLNGPLSFDTALQYPVNEVT